MASFVASSLRTGALPTARMFVTPAARQFTSQPAILRMARANMGRVAAFHTSKQMQILPPGPQVIEGTVNDPVPVPKANPSHGTYHWTFERLVCLSCVPLTVVPFAAGGAVTPVMDALIVSGLLLHSHLAFASVITDYFPKYKVPKFSAFLTWLLRIATAGVTYGFYQLQTNDVGLTETVKRIWTA